MIFGSRPVVRNLVANSLNQGVSFLVNIFTVPIYFALLGVEQYGLIGFAVVVQTWVNLLEVGMSGTLGREMTRFKAGRVDEAELLSFVRSLEHLFLGAILILPLVGFAISQSWTVHWFSGSSLRSSVISQSIVLIVALAAVRLAGNLYRGGLMGLERQVFASAVSISGSVARLLVPLPFMLATRDVRSLFLIWLLVSALELVVLRAGLTRVFTVTLSWKHFSLAAFGARTHVWGSIGIAAIIWTVVSQADKVILARILPLSAYGQFTLVMVLSNGLLSVPTPIALAYQPRFTHAAARGDQVELGRLVRDASRLMIVLAVAPAIVLALAPGLAIFAWTGNRSAAAAVSSYAGIYLLGSALLAPTTIMYCIQLAYGNLRLHVRVLIAGAIIIIPGVIMVAQHYGAAGAARLWLTINLACFLFYDPVVIRRFLPGETFRWYGMVTLPPLIAAAVVVLIAIHFGSELQSLNRVAAIATIVGIEILSVSAAAMVAFVISKMESDPRLARKYNDAHAPGAGESA